MTNQLDPDDPVSRALPPGESIRAYIPARNTHILVTDERIAVVDQSRLTLNVQIAALRRIQFDIERERPATLVIVPEKAAHEPQVVAIPPEQFPAVGHALAYIGQRLYEQPSGG